MSKQNNDLADDLKRDLAEAHAEKHPDGCADWCEACRDRLQCRNGRHEWPKDFSDGDTCFCGSLYLFANVVDERPHVMESKR